MPAFMTISLALCPIAVAAAYATTFATPEDPLTEGMIWQHATNIWKHVRIVGDGSAANPHRAVGHDNQVYDDACAQLAGFAPDQLAEAIIWIDPTIPAHEIHEVELHLRWADSPGTAGTQESARGYELLLAYDGAYTPSFGGMVPMDASPGCRWAITCHRPRRSAISSGAPPSVPLIASILITTMALASCCCAQQSIPAAAVVPGGMVISASGSVRLAIISRVRVVTGSDSLVLSQVR